MSSPSPLDYAKQGDVDYFKTVELNVLQNFKGEYGDGILALTAYEGQLDCCREIYQRCPEQLFCQNRHGNSILHHVARHRGGMLSMLEFFLDVGVKAKEDIESGVGEDNIQFKEWCKLQNQDGETALLRTIKVNNLEAAGLWLKVDTDHELQLFSIANNEGNTPLHLAVLYEHFEMVELLIRDKLDFEYGANRNGKTPFMLAIQNDQSRSSSSDVPEQIRQLLFESIQLDQIKVRTGNKGWTLLHYAAYKGDLTAVKYMIRSCPDCMDMVDSEGQNFLHTAVKFGKTNLVSDILGAEQIHAKILNEQDNNGNTPLHIAALSGNEPTALCLLYDVRVKKTTTNSNNQRVLDAINFEFDKRKAGIRIRDKLDEKDLSFQINLGLVTATLIATVTFTAGITLPGGYISQGTTNLGMATLSKSASFEVFVISNNFALLLSIYAVFNNLCANYLLKRDDIIHRLQTATLCSLLALLLMVVAFMTGSYAVLAISNRIAITILVTSSSFVVFMFHAVYRDIIKNMKYRVYDA